MLHPGPSPKQAIVAMVLLLLTGCGAKTSLRVREAGVPDAAVLDGAWRDVPSVDSGFSDAPPPNDAPTPSVIAELPGQTLDKLDLLVLVDNSNSMRENQSNLVAQLGPMIDALASPPDLDGNGVPDFLSVRSIHAGVVSSDLGTPGFSTPGCANPDVGDDGRLNPIRYGEALQRHEPWTAAPSGFRPGDCSDANQFPPFITFDSQSTNRAAFAHDFVCNAALYVNGCGLEQQLEAVHRALVIHDARERAGNTSPNAGFLRDDALLAIVVLTDEEDGSVRDCRYAEPNHPCRDATPVFDPTATNWSSGDLNLRMYLYQPGGDQDPTWPLDRYVDPHDAARGWFALKPGHPERIFFAAIAGVPLEIPSRSDGRVDWDRLLGVPAADREDFTARDASRAIEGVTAEGPFSMHQALVDVNCTRRVVPACRREGTTFDPGACTADQQYFAWPSRRVAEVARRFDESPLCNGAACRNGVIGSICRTSYRNTFEDLRDRLLSRLPAQRCLPGEIALDTDGSTGLRRAPCVMRELGAAGTSCDVARGRVPEVDTSGVPRVVTTPEGARPYCIVHQLGIDAGGMHERGLGWYYATGEAMCAFQAAFSSGADPAAGSEVELVCAASAVR